MADRVASSFERMFEKWNIPKVTVHVVVSKSLYQFWCKKPAYMGIGWYGYQKLRFGQYRILAEKPLSSIPSKRCTNLIFTWTVTYSSSWSELHPVKAAQLWDPGPWTPWKHKYKKIQADCRFSADTDSATLLVGHTWWWRRLFVKVLWSPFIRDGVLYTSLLNNTTCYIITFFRFLHSTASLHTLSPLLALPVQPAWPAWHVN